MSKAKIGFLFGAALVALSAQVQATDACTGSAADATIATQAGSFIVNGFTMKCSNNVYLGYTESDTAIGVCAASKKGSMKYGGTSDGGSVGEKGSAGTVSSVPGSSATAGCS